MVKGLKLEAVARDGLVERSKERGERSRDPKKREKKTQKSILAKIYIPAETHRNPPEQPKHTETPRNFYPRWNGGVSRTSLHTGTRFSDRSSWNGMEYTTMINRSTKLKENIVI